uniref:Uncharacterized protein n=1 Tax=Sparus aurata TaxID=8175 RepID=A0A671VDL1_SPAAU
MLTLGRSRSVCTPGRAPGLRICKHHLNKNTHLGCIAGVCRLV